MVKSPPTFPLLDDRCHTLPLPFLLILPAQPKDQLRMQIGCSTNRSIELPIPDSRPSSSNDLCQSSPGHVQPCSRHVCKSNAMHFPGVLRRQKAWPPGLEVAPACHNFADRESNMLPAQTGATWKNLPPLEENHPIAPFDPDSTHHPRGIPSPPL